MALWGADLNDADDDDIQKDVDFDTKVTLMMTMMVKYWRVEWALYWWVGSVLLTLLMVPPCFSPGCQWLPWYHDDDGDSDDDDNDNGADDDRDDNVDAGSHPFANGATLV